MDLQPLPYALAWHQRIQAVAREYAERAVVFLGGELERCRALSRRLAPKMRKRVEAGEFASPYLHDETQAAARAYGALKTPDVFVLDGELRLVYRGAPDADYDDEGQNAVWLRALDAVLSGGAPDPVQTEPVGCGIKWRE